MAIQYCDYDIKGTLDVAGDSTFASAVYIPSYIVHTGDTDTLFGFAGQNIFIVNTGGGRRLTVTSTEATFENDLIVDGDVGIGTTGPTTKLNVSGNISVSSGSYLSFIDSNLSYNKIGRNTSVGGIQITTGASATMNLLDNGNVGIGQDTPLNSLDVYRATGDASVRIQAETAASSTILKFRNSNADADITVDYTTSNLARMVFTTDNSGGYVPVLSLEANRDTLMYGKVGVGTTSPSFKLQTNATITGSWLGYLNGTSATFGTNNFSAVHSSTAIGTGTESGINLANNASDNDAPSPIISFSAKSASASYQHAYAAIYGIKTATGADTNWNKGDLVFATGQGTGPNERVRINSAGAIRFNDYGAGTLVTDASGNITVSSGGGAGGPYLPLAGGTLTGNLNIQYDGGTNPIGLVIHNTSTEDAADAKIEFETQGAIDYSIGIDRSDSNKFKISRSSSLQTNNVLAFDSNSYATFAGVIVNEKGITSDGAAKAYTWRIENTGNNSNYYYKIARVQSTQSARFKLQMVGGHSYSDGVYSSETNAYGQLNNDNNYDLIFHQLESDGQGGSPILAFGQVDVSTTSTDLYVQLNTFSELVITASISDGSLTPYDSSTGSSTAPTGFVAATEQLGILSTTVFQGTVKLDSQLLDGSNDVGTAGQLLSSTGSITNWVDASTVIGGPYLPLTGGTLSGNLAIETASTPKITLQDTTNDVKLLMYAQDTNAVVGTYSTHSLDFYTDSTLALAINTAQNATFKGGATIEGGFLNLYGVAPVMTVDSSNANSGFRLNVTGLDTDSDLLYRLQAAGTVVFSVLRGGDATFTGLVNGITPTANANFTTKQYVDSLITGATIYRGTWDPDVSLNSGYGNPNLNTVTQTSGYYYICSADGTAIPNGTATEPNTWSTGDWVIWNDDLGTSGEWQKIDNSSVISGAGTGQTVALWEGTAGVAGQETLGDSPITVSGNNTSFAGTGTFGGNVTISNASPALNLTDTDNSSNIAFSSVGGALVVNSTSDQVYQIGGTEYFRIATSGATFGGLVSGITPTAAANFTTKNYVDTTTAGYRNLTFVDGTEKTDRSTGVPAPNRTSNPDPQDYDRVFATEFKNSANIGSPVGNAWAGLISMAPYNVASNFITTQLAFAASGSDTNLYKRQGSGTTWSSWDKLLTQGNSGTGPFLPLVGGTLSGPGNLTVSNILTVAGAATFTAQGAAGYGSINLESEDPFIRLYDNGAASTTDKKKWDIRAIGASGAEQFDIRTINDANTVFSTKLSIAHNGDSTFSGTVTGTTAFFTTLSGDLKGTINTVTTGVTQSPVDSSNKIATTRYVDTAVGVIPLGNYLPLAGGTMTGTLTNTTTTAWGTNLKLINTNADVSPPILTFLKNGGSPADNDYVGFTNYRMDNSNGDEFSWVELSALAIDVTDGSESSAFRIGTWGEGTEYSNTIMAKSGKVGIGVTNPSTPLQVNGIVRIDTGSDTAFYEGASVRVFGTQAYGFRNSGGTYVANISMNGDSYFNGGNVGIGTNSPFSKLQVGSNTFTGANGMYADSRVGISNHGSLTGMMLASTYNDANHPEYGLVFVQGPSTSSYNVWSISPDSPLKGDSLSFIYQLQGTNIHSTTPKVVFDGNGNVGIGPTSKTWVPETKLHITGTTDANIIRIENTSTSLSLGSTIGAIQFFNNDPTDNSPNVAASIYATAGASGGSGSLRFKTTEPGVEGDPATDTMIITNGGKVGIGVTGPSEKLEVSGNIKATRVISNIIRDTNGNSQLTTTVVNASNTSTIVGNTATANTLSLGVKSSGDVLVPNGDVGIGVSPAYKLHVQGDVYSNDQFISKAANDDVQYTAAGDENTGLGDFDLAGSCSLVGDGKKMITIGGASNKFPMYDATSVATTGSLNANQSQQALSEDTLATLGVDPDGNVVRGSQEGTWTFTKAQLDALTTSTTSGTTLIAAPGANKAIIVEESNLMIKYSGTDSMSSNSFVIRQGNNGDSGAEITRLPSGQINTIMSSAPTNPSYGFYSRDLPLYNNDGRSFVTNKATFLTRINTTDTPGKLISISIKLKYRIFNAATF